MNGPYDLARLESLIRAHPDWPAFVSAGGRKFSWCFISGAKESEYAVINGTRWHSRPEAEACLRQEGRTAEEARQLVAEAGWKPCILVTLDGGE